MELKEIKELIKTIKESDFTTFEYEAEGIKLVLKREKEVAEAAQVTFAAPAFAPQAFPQFPQGAGQGASAVSGGAQAASGTQVTSSEGAAAAPAQAAGHLVKSPIVGTYYGSPSPEAGPFVTVGKKVKKGDVLCIIEAMKLMNEIEADRDGEIAEAFCESEQMVEYGQPLFRIV